MDFISLTKEGRTGSQRERHSLSRAVCGSACVRRCAYLCLYVWGKCERGEERGRVREREREREGEAKTGPINVCRGSGKVSVFSPWRGAGERYVNTAAARSEAQQS